jgi:hypothetical protein
MPLAATVVHLSAVAILHVAQTWRLTVAVANAVVSVTVPTVLPTAAMVAPEALLRQLVAPEALLPPLPFGCPPIGMGWCGAEPIVKIWRDRGVPGAKTSSRHSAYQRGGRARSVDVLGTGISRELGIKPRMR